MENKIKKNTDNQIKVVKVINGIKYDVRINFSKTSKETMLDKIKRIVVKEIEKK